MYKKSWVLGLVLVLILTVSNAAWALGEIYFSYVPSGNYTLTPASGSQSSNEISSLTMGGYFMDSTNDSNQFQIGGGAEDIFSEDFWSISGYIASSYRLIRSEMDPRLIGKLGFGLMMGMGDAASGNDMVELSYYYAFGPSIKLGANCRADLLYVGNTSASMNYSNLTFSLGYS